MNVVHLTGRPTTDPARRDTTNGVVAEFRLAVDGRRPDRLWITVEAWGQTAAVVTTHLTARRHIAVSGRLRLDEYHDRTGTKQTRYRVIADRIEFLDPPARPDQPQETTP